MGPAIRDSMERLGALVYLETQWSVAMRYEVQFRDPRDVRKFIEKAREFTRWLLSD